MQKEGRALQCLYTSVHYSVSCVQAAPGGHDHDDRQFPLLRGSQKRDHGKPQTFQVKQEPSTVFMSKPAVENFRTNLFSCTFYFFKMTLKCLRQFRKSRSRFWRTVSYSKLPLTVEHFQNLLVDSQVTSKISSGDIFS